MSGTSAVGPLLHENAVSAGIQNTLQLTLLGDSLKAEEPFPAIAQPGVQNRYQTYPEKKTKMLATIALLAQTLEEGQEQMAQINTRLERAYQVIGTEEKDGRLDSQERSRLESQRDLISQRMEQSRQQKKDRQEQIKFDQDQHKETTKMVKDAINLLRPLFNTGDSEIGIFEGPLDDGQPTVTLLECIQTEKPHDLWRLLEAYSAQYKPNVVDFIRGLGIEYGTFTQYLGDYHKIIMFREKLGIESSAAWQYDTFIPGHNGKVASPGSTRGEPVIRKRERGTSEG